MHPAESEKDRRTPHDAAQREAEHLRRLQSALEFERRRRDRRAKQIARRACHIQTAAR